MACCLVQVDIVSLQAGSLLVVLDILPYLEFNRSDADVAVLVEIFKSGAEVLGGSPYNVRVLMPYEEFPAVSEDGQLIQFATIITIVVMAVCIVIAYVVYYLKKHGYILTSKDNVEAHGVCTTRPFSVLSLE